MKTFINVAQMKLASLKEGQFVETGGYYTKGDAGQAKYLIVAAQAADGYGDHTLANGTVAVLQVGDVINVKQFGAVGDGVADDTLVIQAAYIASINLFFPDGEYRTTSAITFDASYTNLDFSENARIYPDGTHTGVIIGSPTLIPTRMKINRLKVDRRSYQASTIGILFLEVNQSTFDEMESRFSAWNFTFRPTTAGCAYNTFNNAQAIGGQYNFWLNTDSGTGFTNENTFVGGRGFCTANTITNLRISGTGENGHNKFISVSLEGQGSSGIYDDGGSNAFYNCRSEGTWTSAFHQVGPNALYYTIVSGRYDYTMDAPLKDTQRGTVLVYQDGSILSSAVDGKTTLTLSNDANANGTGLAINMQNDNTDIAFKVHVTDSGIDRTVLTNSGLLTLATGIDCPLGGWNRIPLELRGTRIWTDSANRVLQKSGSDPTGEIDGNSIGLGATQLTVGAAGSGAALPATPSGYTNVRVGNNDFVIPYYAKT